MAEDWYKAEGKGKKKEITIKLKLNLHMLKNIGHILLIALLLTIIILQQTGIISTGGNNNSNVGSATQILNLNGSIENKTTEKDTNKSNTIIIKGAANATNLPPVENKTVKETEPVIELLPITGEVYLIIDNIKIDPKANIEDYAKVTQVTFTIRNQDKDFVPKIVGYLSAYAGEEEKSVTLDATLNAGRSITVTEKKLAFGYDEPEETHTLNLEIYNGKKFIRKVSKDFTTP